MVSANQKWSLRYRSCVNSECTLEKLGGVQDVLTVYPSVSSLLLDPGSAGQVLQSCPSFSTTFDHELHARLSIP